MIQIKLNEEIIEDSIEAKELAGDKKSDFYSLMILNDIDSIINKKYSRYRKGEIKTFCKNIRDFS